MELSLSLTLPEEIFHIPMVRRVSCDVLRSFGVGQEDLDDIELLVGELATNAVYHAHDNTYDVEIKVENDLAVITVSDHGIGFARHRLPPQGSIRQTSVGGWRYGGFGLPLIEKLADRVDFTPNVPHGTIVRAEKRLHRIIHELMDTEQIVGHVADRYSPEATENEGPTNSRVR